MKLHTKTLLAALAFSLTPGAVNAATLVFSDNYVTAANNQDINAGLGTSRTAGTAEAAITAASPGYNVNGSSWQTQLRVADGGKLLLGPNTGPGGSPVWAGPNYDFSGDVGDQYQISFDVDPNNYGGAATGFTFGVNAANQGKGLTDNHGGLSLRFEETNDTWTMYSGADNSTNSVANGDEAAAGFRTVLLEVTETASDVTVKMSINGVLQTTYVYTGSFAGNYMFFTAETDRNNTDSSYFDNFTVTAVPEPGSLALLGLGGLCMLKRRRRDV